MRGTNESDNAFKPHARLSFTYPRNQRSFTGGYESAAISGVFSVESDKGYGMT